MKCETLMKSSSPILVNAGLVSLLTVRATNDKGTGGTTRAPLRSSVPKGYRSIPPAIDPRWIDSLRYANRPHSEVGGRFVYQFGDLRSTSDCLDTTSRQSPCLLRWFQDTRGGCAIKKCCEATFDAQTGWSEMFLTTPSAPFK